MPSTRRNPSPGGDSRYLLVQCDKCGAQSSAYVSERGVTLNAVNDNGVHTGCGGRLRGFDIRRTEWCAGYRMSPHAVARQREMKIPDRELAACLIQPEQTYTQTNRDPGDKVFQRGRVAAVVNRKLVKTILWRTQDEYERGDK